MKTMNLRRLVLGIAGATILIPSLGAAQAHASQYVLPKVPVKNMTRAEGASANYVFKLPTCKYDECAYKFSVAPGTAKSDGLSAGTKDYNPFAYLTWALQRGQRKTIKFPVKVLEDTVCERDEYFFVKAEVKYAINDRYGAPGPVQSQGTVTIPRNDCDVVSDRVENGPVVVADRPAVPAGDNASATTTERNYGTGTIRSCTTPLASGVQGQFGAWGHYIAGCTVTLKCPPEVQVCGVKSESRINAENYNGQRVTLNQRVRVFSASGNNYWFRDNSCDNTDWCLAEDQGINVRGGESASVQCNGVRASGPAANRAKVTCNIDMALRAL